ncbi:hypothetical protein V1264_023558 [Littorina saxatilis]|uniref:Reverse transcriptase n=1 Tax=Littorina saxatilis TaxID=31220 RepID=A0AAN9B8N0_9CAEN
MHALGKERVSWIAWQRKAASRLTQPSNPATYGETKTLVRSKFRADWVAQNGGYRADQDPIRKLERNQQTLIFRLRTGHCGLRAPLKRIRITDTTLCECGQADQTPSHMLQDCPSHEARRREQWPDGTDLRTKLWGTAYELRRTASFAASLGERL